MALLRDKLRKAKVGTGLQQMSEEELQQLSTAAGRAAPPTTPLEAGAIGAEPDSAKMAGTGQQKASALRQSIQGADRLQDVMRRADVRRQATEGEAGKVERGRRLEQLGGLQGRVQALTDQLTAQAAAATGATEDTALILRADAAADIPAGQEEEFKNRLVALNQNPSDFANLKAVNNMLGITNIDDMITAENLTQRFLTTTEQAGQITAESFQDQATVADLDLTELGYDSPDELANLLGVSPEELQGLNIRQIIEETEAQIEQEHTQVADLQRKSTDPNLGAAERAEARRQLREMGAVGIRKSESDIDDMADQIESADTVEFAGEEITIAEMLDDEYLSGLTAQYLNPEATPEFREQLEKNEPELVEWINNNKNVLDAAVAEIGVGLGEFAELNYQNQAIADTEVGDLSDDIMGEIFDDWGEIRDEEYPLEDYDLLDILNDDTKPKRMREDMYQAVNQVYEAEPSLAHEMATLSEQELAAAGVTNRNSQKWQDYSNYLDQYERIKNMNPADPDSVAEAVFGEGTTFDKANEQIKEAQVRERTGLFGDSGTSGYQGIIDTRNDSLGDPTEVAQSLREKLTSQGKPIGLRAAIQNTPPQLSKAMQGLSGFNQKPDPTAGLYNKIKFAFEGPQDKTFDINDARNANLNHYEIEQLWKQPGFNNKMTESGRAVFKDKFNNATFGDLNRFLGSSGGLPAGYNYNKALSETRHSPGQLNEDTRDTLRNTLQIIEAQERAAENQGRPLATELYRNLANNLRGGVQDYDRRLAEKRAGERAEQERLQREEQRRKTDEARRMQAWQANPYLGMAYEVDRASGGQISGALKGAGGGISKSAKKAFCFIAGTKFRLANGESRRVELITPRDELFGGGATYSTVCAVGDDMYEYNGIGVSGSHAVYEANEGWIRVKDSAISVRRPDLDGQYVYVISNVKHRMIAADGTIFTDYDEVDMPDTDEANLEQLRNQSRVE